MRNHQKKVAGQRCWWYIVPFLHSVREYAKDLAARPVVMRIVQS